MTTYNVITCNLEKIVFVTFFENRTLKKEGREAEKKVKQLSAIQNTVIKKNTGRDHLYLREVVRYE